VWHASAATTLKLQFGDTNRWLEKRAREALLHVGNASMGEWVEHTGRAVHVRRRLTLEEEARVGPAVDLRGSAEAREIYDRTYRRLPSSMWRMAKEETLLPIGKVTPS
jgi:hypothetical protein